MCVSCLPVKQCANQVRVIVVGRKMGEEQVAHVRWPAGKEKIKRFFIGQMSQAAADSFFKVVRVPAIL